MKSLLLPTVVFFGLTLAWTSPISAIITQDDKAGSSTKNDITNEIVVTGRAKLEKAVAEYIDATFTTPKGGRFAGQYARFGAPVCPAAYGFSDSNNRQIDDRIRKVAKAAEIPVGDAGCQTNIFVVVISDGKDAITELRAKHHRIFGTLPIYRRNQLADSKGPFFGWKSIVTTTADGAGSRVASNGSTFTGTGNQISSGSSPFVNEVPILHTNVKSLVKRPTQQIVQSAFLLLEEKALIGMTTVQIADFAAMYNLIEADSSVKTNAAPNSILTLFNDQISPEDRPASISEWDIIMLSALYHSPLNVAAPLQRSAMQQRIVREIEQAN